MQTSLIHRVAVLFEVLPRMVATPHSGEGTAGCGCPLLFSIGAYCATGYAMDAVRSAG